MNAVVYRRKSNAEKGDTSPSVQRQLEQAQAFIKLKNWVHVETFTDDGISGAVPWHKRPGLNALITALPSQRFTVIVVAAQDRLSRDQWDSAEILARIARAGCRLFLYQTNSEVDLGSSTGRFLASVTSYGPEYVRETLANHMKDQLKLQAKNGLVHGGSVYGYINVRLAKRHVERRIHKEQAKVIRTMIFEQFVAGQSPTAITQKLNMYKIPAKTPGRPWTVGSVRHILRRKLYKGIVESHWGAETFTVKNEQLRIVSDALWAKAAQKLAEIKQIYLRTTGGRLAGKPPRNESVYLLSGLFACGLCGNSMTVRGWKGSKSMICSAHLIGTRRHYEPCANALPLHMASAEEAILSILQHAVLQPEIIERVITKAIKKLWVGKPTERQAVEQALKGVNLELTRLTAAVVNGEPFPTLVAAMKDAERRKVTLEGQLRGFQQAEQIKALDLTYLREKLTARLKDWQGLLDGHPALKRQLLKKLIPEKLVLMPNPADRSYTFTGWGRLEDVVAGLFPEKLLQMWWPQRDSNPCSHAAARFCQRINHLRRVESTSIGRGRKSSPRFPRGLMKPRSIERFGAPRARREGAIVKTGTAAT